MVYPRSTSTRPSSDSGAARRVVPVRVSTPLTSICFGRSLVPQLPSAAGDVFLKLRPHAVVERRRCVGLELRAPDVGRPGARVLPTVSRPPVEVLAGRQER